MYIRLSNQSSGRHGNKPTAFLTVSGKKKEDKSCQVMTGNRVRTRPLVGEKYQPDVDNPYCYYPPPRISVQVKQHMRN